MRSTLGALALALAATALAGCSQPPCNDECGEGFKCDETLMACVKDDGDGGTAGECRTDAECTAADKRHCEPSTRRCVGCVVDGDCPSGRCDATTFSCVTGTCEKPSDCANLPGKTNCSAAGLCVECLADTDCPPQNGIRRTCDVLLNRCTANPCRQDADCTTDAGGRVCDSASGSCVGCIRDEQCPVPAHGQPRCQASTHACVACLSDSDCDAAQGEQCEIATGTCHTTGCVSDLACAPLLCDTGSRKCVACESQSDCAFGGLCVNKACAPPPSCAIDGDCVWPGRCVLGACAACRDDGDCRSGQTCTNGRCEEPASCTSATQCGSGRTCLSGTCQPASCTADAFEPNDDAAHPSPVPPGTISAALCPNEVDNYELAFQEGAGATVTITYDATQGTPKLSLVAGPSPAPQAFVATGVPGRLSATIEHAPAGTRALLVRVEGGDGASRLAYSLQLSVDASGACADDSREPDDSTAQAVPGTPGIYQGVLCPLDSDWLAIPVPAGSRIVASVSAPGARFGSASLEIWSLQNGNPHRDAYGMTSATGDASAQQSKAAVADTTEWVGVRNLGSLKLPYTLTLDVRPPPPDNDHCAQATVLPLNATVSGNTRAAVDDGSASCGGAGGDVFHTLTLTEPSQVTIAATSDFPAVLALADGCAGSELACAVHGSGGTRLSFEALPAGSYVLRVDAASGDAGSYQLSTTVAPATPAPAAESCATAETLAFSSGVALAQGSLALAANDATARCGTDGGDAVYAFHLDAAQHLKATLSAFEGASVSLVPAASCATLDGAVCAAQAASAAATLLDRTVVEAGDWVLVVDGGSALRGAFSLKVELSEPLYPPANDACDGALDLVGTVSGDTRGAADDFAPSCGAAGASSRDAVYRLVLAEDSDVTLSLSANFDAALAITADGCATGASLGCIDGFQKSLRLPALAAGIYWVWVDGYAGGSGTFSLSATVGPALPVPSNDLCSAPEVVDVSAGPATVSGATLRATDDLHPASCAGVPSSSGPEVVYAVDVPAGKALIARLLPDFDGALYVLDSCDASSCVAGSDQSFQAGGTESLRVAATGADRRLLVVVDSWRASVSGTFQLTLSAE